jgi:hypothetical protein
VYAAWWAALVCLPRASSTSKEVMRAARAYIAGTGATAALVAAVAGVLLSLAALVTFEGLPGGSGEPEDGSVFVGPGASSGTAQGAAAALAAAPGAVAAAPVPVGAGPGVASPGGGGPVADGVAPPDAPGVPSPPEGGGDGAVPPPGTSQGGPIGGVVDAVDETAAGLGVDPGLGEATDPITGPVDQALDDNLPGVSGASAVPAAG